MPQLAQVAAPALDKSLLQRPQAKEIRVTANIGPFLLRQQAQQPRRHRTDPLHVHPDRALIHGTGHQAMAVTETDVASLSSGLATLRFPQALPAAHFAGQRPDGLVLIAVCPSKSQFHIRTE